jgi:hypothetical protein
MQTITVDILNDNAFKLLQDLEHMQLIRLREDNTAPKIKLSDKYKGIVNNEQAESLNSHINEVRSEWKNI